MCNLYCLTNGYPSLDMLDLICLGGSGQAVCIRGLLAVGGEIYTNINKGRLYKVLMKTVEIYERCVGVCAGE